MIPLKKSRGLRRTIICMPAGLLLPAAVVLTTGAAAPPAPNVTPQLAAAAALAWSPPGVYDFGALTSGTRSKTFTLTNTGGRVARNLRETVTGEGFTKTAKTCRARLRPGQSCTVTVQYAFHGSTAHTDTGTLTAAAANAVRTTVTLIARSGVSGVPNVSIGSPAQCSGTQYGGNLCYWNVNWVYGSGPIDQTFAAINNGTGPAHVTDIVVVPGDADASYLPPAGTCTGATLNPGQSCTFLVRITPHPDTCTAGAKDEIAYRITTSDLEVDFADLAVTWTLVCPS